MIDTNILNRLLAPFRDKLMLMVSRVVIKAIHENNPMQTAQVTGYLDEAMDNIERIGQYGFQSSPKPGAEGVMVLVGGDRGHGIIIATEDRRFRLKTLAPGEVALYTDEGDTVIFKRGKNIQVTTTTLSITATNTNITGNLKVGGATELDGAVVMKSTAEIDGAATLKSTAAVTGMVTATAGVTSVGPVLAPAVTTTGAVVAAGVDLGASVSSNKSNYNAHTHVAPNGGGTTTTTSLPD